MIVIGLLELAVWTTGSPVLLRALPASSAMEANAALCFVLCGASLFVVQAERLERRRHWIVYVCAGLVMLFGLVTIGEHLSGKDWGIDQLLFSGAAETKTTSRPGQLTPTTAFCFALAAAALLLLTRKSPSRLMAAITVSLSAFVVGFGVVAIAGYAIDAVFGNRGWNFTGTSLHTALTFLLLGLGQVTVSARRHDWSWALERATTVCFVTGVILLIAVCAVTYRALNSFAETAARVAQTHQVQAEVGHLQRALVEGVAARRAYLVAFEESHLANLRNAVRRAQEHLATLARLTADNPRQRDSVAELERVLVGPLSRATELPPTAAVPQPALGSPAAARPQASSEQFLNLLGRISAEEDARLRGRQQEARRNFDLALAVVPAGTFGTVLLLSVALFLLNREAGDRKRTQADLLDSERRYRLLFESSPLPMWVYDLETFRFYAVNAAAISFYGYTREEFLELTIKDIRPPEEVGPLLEAIAVMPRSGRFQSPRTWKHRKKDGTNVLMEVTTHDLVFDGQPARLVLANDVTARVHAEEKLAAERSLLRTVIDLLPDFIYVKDRDSRFVTANAAYAHYLGAKSPTELGGRKDDDFYSADAAADYRFDELHVLEGKPMLNKEELVAAPDSPRRILLTTKVPLRDGPGNIVGLVGTGRDITAAKAAENAIRQLNADLELRVRQRTAQLEGAIKELESFSYSVSHDLRAPLRHVQGYVAMLQRATEGQLSEKAQRHLKTINDASVEMGQLIDDLLDFSRMGRVEMSEDRVSLDSLLRDTLRGQELATQGRNIVWKTAPLPQVVGDASMLRQVLVNLVGNAVKYTRERNPAEIEIGCKGEEDGRAIIFVRDNGAGFDMQYVHKLFGVFQRLHRSDEFEGTGIGLATVRRVVSRHGGRVWAEGAIGRGATFYFTVRRAIETPRPTDNS